MSDDDELDGDEAVLLGRLADALGPDPLPEGMVERATALWSLRDLDHELVALLEEGAAEPAGMRGTPATSARLSFELADGSVSLELVLDEDTVRGQLLAGAVSAVAVERPDGPVSREAVDRLGRFAFPHPGSGPSRLRLFRDGAGPAVTDWFLI